MTAGQRLISEIFTNTRILEIPFFQRSYVWDRDNWERFLDDMIIVSAENIPYFMGSVILKQELTPIADSIGDIRLLVDGQQRLTTLVLFFKEAFGAKNDDDSFVRIFYNVRGKIILQHNHNDIEIFEAIVKGDLNSDLKKKYANSKILQCHEFLKENKNQMAISNICPYTILDKLYFVGIELTADEDEQQIFDTINSLGVDLTTAELLKNELFKRGDEALFDSTWKKEFEVENREFWDKVVTFRPNRPNIDILLQSYLLICSDAREKYMGLGSLFKKYKSYMKDTAAIKGKDNREKFVRNLMGCAKTYQENIGPRLLDEDINKDLPIERMNLVIFGLNTTTVIPYLLYILQNVNDEEERNAMVSLLEGYIVRRVICRESSRNYNKMFASFIRNAVLDCDRLRKAIYKPDADYAGKFPDDESLRQGFEGNNLTNQTAKTVLYFIEKHLRGRMDGLTLLGLSKYELEHIMPKNWRSKWRDGLDEEKSRERDQELRKLGNLTIITPALNKSIRDSDWETKKEGSGNKKGLVAYSTGMKILDTDEYLRSDRWDEEKIRHRSNFLFEKAREIWPYER